MIFFSIGGGLKKADALECFGVFAEAVAVPAVAVLAVAVPAHLLTCCTWYPLHYLLCLLYLLYLT